MPLIYRLPPGQGALSRLLSTVTLIAVFAIAFFLGTVLFLVVLGVIVILAAALYVRFWWLRRQSAGQQRSSPKGGVTLEGEYTVAKTSKKPQRDDRA